MPQRPKPPKQTKVELMDEVRMKLSAGFTNERSRIEFLLNYFTAVDLEHISKELKS